MNVDRFSKLIPVQEKLMAQCYGDRELNTHKKLREAMSMAERGLLAEKTILVLKTLDELWHGHGIGDVIDKVQTLTMIQHTIQYEPEYFKRIDLDLESMRIPARLSMKFDVADLILKNIPDFYPTPPHIIEMMILQHRGNMKGVKRILEPSAGNGNMVDYLKDKFPEIAVDCLEVNYSLSEILQKKGHNVERADFLDWKASEEYDLIIMNPPFAKASDVDHIMKAYEVVKDGGTVIALASSGAINNSTKKHKALQALIEENGFARDLGRIFEKAERPVSVGMCLIYLEKPFVPEKPVIVPTIVTEPFSASEPTDVEVAIVQLDFFSLIT